MTTLGKWYPANNGAGKHIWFLYRDAAEVADRYHESKAGFLIRYKTMASAQRAADRLNEVST